MKQFDIFADSQLLEEQKQPDVTDEVKVEEIKPDNQAINIDNELQTLWHDWKPKDKSKLTKADHTHKLTHGWLMRYLFRWDELTNKRWEYWLKIQRLSPAAYYEYLTKGLTDKFVKEAIHCHKYPKLTFSQDSKAYAYLNSVIDLICGDRSISGLDAFEFLLDWLLYGFGHEDFTKLPTPKSREKNMSSFLYEYFDLFPFLVNPYDYFGLLLPELYGDGHKGKVGFFPTPMSVCVAMQQMLYGNSDQPTIQSFIEPSAGTGSLLLAWSNAGLCGSITELSNTCTKAALVNSYFYAPQFARPLWYLLKDSSFICGNTLSEEIFIDYHAKYRKHTLESLAQDFAPLAVK